MRIGWVLPWLHRVGGNKLALSLAAETARNGHDVEMFAHTVRAEILPEVHRQLGQARLTDLRETDRPYSVYRDTLSWQLARGREAALARAIGTSHARAPFDVLVLVANEGGRLGHRLHDGLAPPRPLVGRSVMELIDHSFLLRRERPHAALRGGLAPLYPALHWAWGRQLDGFDFLCANSSWTAELLEYLYGRVADRLLVSVPDEAFLPARPTTPLPEGPFVAVPTVSFGPSERRRIADAVAARIPIVTFGTTTVPGAKNLG
ncbi:MAG TPA: hypothetical protein VMD28_08785, partial [Acidimicrobiales bacterium]|nr:hypothetical protein [Acidimicrobiales bacterium]